MRAAVLCAAGLAAGAAHAESLPEAIALAYQTNPSLAGQRAQLRALDETYVQARGGFRPQLSVSGEADYLQGAQSFFKPIKDVGASLSASQPIYSGGSVTAEVRAAQADIAAGRQQLRQVEADVLRQVIAAYVDVRRDQQALDIAQTNLDVLNHQMAETNARFDVGQLTRTDVAQSQARAAAAQAEASSARAALAISRAAYAAVVGQDPADLAPEPDLPGLPASAEAAFDAAARDNPAILAADFGERAAAARVAVAKAANHPTLSLRAQVGETGYYANQPILGLTGAGLWADNITATAVLTQPLFTGGMNASRIRQALEEDNVKRIAIEAAQRATTQAVAQAWNQLAAARANSASNAEQVRADEIAFEGVKQEAGVGLRTTLDVLNADQELRGAELALVGARHDEYLAGAALLAAMGHLEIEALSPGAEVYDPRKSFDRVKDVGAAPWEGLVAGLDAIGQPPPPPSPGRAGGPVAP